MPQMHLYVPKEIAEEVKRRAGQQGVSTSRYLADLVRREVADDWPPGFFGRVIGGCADAPLQRPPELPVEQREALAPRDDRAPGGRDTLTPRDDRASGDRDAAKNDG